MNPITPALLFLALLAAHHPCSASDTGPPRKADHDSVIVTIYFLNQASENRRFQTYVEFIALRDSFVRGYIECVAKKRAASNPG